MTFLPAPEILAAFTVAGLLLILTPGPDMTFFLGQTLTAGRVRGLAAMFGACLGLVFHSMLAAFGLSALLVASTTAFTIIKIAGAFYLVWLGIQAIRHGSALTLKKGAGRKNSVTQVFLMGVGINLLNPKIVMFFLTFLPQFISVSDPHAPEKLMFFGLYFIVLSIPICVRDDPDGRSFYGHDAALAARDADFRLDVCGTDGNVRAAASVRARELERSERRRERIFPAAGRCGPRPANRRSRR